MGNKITVLCAELRTRTRQEFLSFLELAGISIRPKDLHVVQVVGLAQLKFSTEERAFLARVTLNESLFFGAECHAVNKKNKKSGPRQVCNEGKFQLWLQTQRAIEKPSTDDHKLFLAATSGTRTK